MVCLARTVYVKISLLVASEFVELFKVVGRENTSTIGALYFPRSGYHVDVPSRSAVFCDYILSAITAAVIIGVVRSADLTSARNSFARDDIVVVIQLIYNLVGFNCVLISFGFRPLIFFYIRLGIFSFFICVDCRFCLSVVSGYCNILFCRYLLSAKLRTCGDSYFSFFERGYISFFCFNGIARFSRIGNIRKRNCNLVSAAFQNKQFDFFLFAKIKRLAYV